MALTRRHHERLASGVRRATVCGKDAAGAGQRRLVRRRRVVLTSQRDRCEAAVNLFDQLLLEDDQNDELLFLMATAHYNLQSYTMGIEFATELEKVGQGRRLHRSA